jgi:hypothetical protein
MDRAACPAECTGPNSTASSTASAGCAAARTSDVDVLALYDYRRVRVVDRHRQCRIYPTTGERPLNRLPLEDTIRLNLATYNDDPRPFV